MYEYDQKGCLIRRVSKTRHSRQQCAAVLIVVSDFETNIFDQRCIEEAILKAKPEIPILRRTFADLAESTGRVVVETESSRLFVQV